MGADGRVHPVPICFGVWGRREVANLLNREIWGAVDVPHDSTVVSTDSKSGIPKKKRTIEQRLLRARENKKEAGPRAREAREPSGRNHLVRSSLYVRRKPPRQALSSFSEEQTY